MTGGSWWLWANNMNNWREKLCGLLAALCTRHFNLMIKEHKDDSDVATEGSCKGASSVSLGIIFLIEYLWVGV